MFVVERRRAILEVLNRVGCVLVSELAEQFDASLVTIRKDLAVLFAQGCVHRIHGGALPAGYGSLKDLTLGEKEKLQNAEKVRIGAAAVSKVKDGQVIILDSGTTTTAIARALRGFRQLTVITNAINIATELAGTTVEVILTGGMLRKNSFSLVGSIAEDVLRKLHADIFFLGVDGIDVTYGLTTPNLSESRVNRVMSEAAQRTVVVCDSSKFGRRSLSRILPLSGFHEVITDRGISKTDFRALKKAGIQVTLV